MSVFKDGMSLVTLIKDQPWTILIITTLAFGYLYWDKDQKHDAVLTELGGLRAEQEKMHKILKLSVDLAKAECK